MYLLEERLAEEALEQFRRTDNVEGANWGDQFFAIGPGYPTESPDRPFERFSDYEELLRRLRDADARKYQDVHKGTPFHFMSCLAFDMQNYEKALFYLDASVSEDVRSYPREWLQNPGARFLFLDPENQPAARTILLARRILEAELNRFNQVSNLTALEIDGSWRRFVRNLLNDASLRTIISALYVFLLEYEDRRRELELREGSTGGSNQPFTVHLFTGGLLFESLLKLVYPTNRAGNQKRTLGDVLNTRQFKTDFGLATAPPSSAATLTEIHAGIQGTATSVEETAFSTAAKLRNTTGHNLVWDDIFDTPQKYVDLFQSVMNALLFVIARRLV